MKDSARKFILIKLFGIFVSSSQLYSRHTGIKNDHLAGLKKLNMELIVHNSFKSNLLQFKKCLQLEHVVSNIKHSVHVPESTVEMSAH